MGNAEIVRQAVEAYRQQDLGTAERLYAEDFRFTSPQDERLDRATWLATCFPTAGRFGEQRVLDVVEVDGERVFLQYAYELADEGGRYRNVEEVTVRDGLIREVQVFFGGRQP